MRPHVKLIVLVRDPVDRLLANYNHVIKAQKIKKSTRRKHMTSPPPTEWSELRSFLFKDDTPSRHTLVQNEIIKSSRYQV